MPKENPMGGNVVIGISTLGHTLLNPLCVRDCSWGPLSNTCGVVDFLKFVFHIGKAAEEVQ